MRQLKIIGVFVFLEKRKTRTLVGELLKQNGVFVFTYDENYFKADSVIPLGPEFPLTQRKFESKKLFPSLEDRIPSSHNPAYIEYCQFMGIDPKEKDELVLLSTIGRKGPSSFIFYPNYEHEITFNNVIEFRKSLNLTTREFAHVFDLSQASLNALERKRILGKEILKRLEIFYHFPSVAASYLMINGGYLTHDKFNDAISVLRDKVEEKYN